MFKSFFGRKCEIFLVISFTAIGFGGLGVYVLSTFLVCAFLSRASRFSGIAGVVTLTGFLSGKPHYDESHASITHSVPIYKLKSPVRTPDELFSSRSRDGVEFF